MFRVEFGSNSAGTFARSIRLLFRPWLNRRGETEIFHRTKKKEGASRRRDAIANARTRILQLGDSDPAKKYWGKTRN
jgi:hypothetical protein